MWRAHPQHPLSELAKFPYLLLTHHFTTLVIQDVHIKHLHSGVNATVTALQQSYWVPSACQRIKVHPPQMCNMQEVQWKALYHP